MTLGTFPSAKKLASLEGEEPADQSEQMEKLGLSLAPAAKIPGAGEEGVVIAEVDDDSDAADKGLKPGDIILQVAGVDVSTLATLPRVSRRQPSPPRAARTPSRS